MTNGPPRIPPAEIGKKTDQAAQKEERLARALRENLKRRKANKKNTPEECDGA